MIKEEYRNNQAAICGKIVSGFRFSHESYGEKFYIAETAVRRLSGREACIPVMIFGKLADTSKNFTGQCVCVAGQYRSYNRHEGNKSHLELNVFAEKIEIKSRE